MNRDCELNISLDIHIKTSIYRYLNMAKLDSLQGSLDLLVLKILSRRPRSHGYAIMAAVGELSGDVLRAEEGSLYPALHRMEEAGWIRAKWITKDSGRRARIYELTAAETQIKLHPDYSPTTYWAFDGVVPGPLIQAKYGEPVLVRFHNHLPSVKIPQAYGIAEVTTHLHNGHTPSESDGNPVNGTGGAREVLLGLKLSF